jgi:hypothetical protein
MDDRNHIAIIANVQQEIICVICVKGSHYTFGDIVSRNLYSGRIGMTVSFVRPQFLASLINNMSFSM